MAAEVDEMLENLFEQDVEEEPYEEVFEVDEELESGVCCGGEKPVK